MYLRTDALIIQRDRFTSLELPVLYSDVKKFTTKPEIDRQTLEWLWDGIASPVLESLGYSDIPTSSTWPRIFWIPTGPLSALPIHAAGYHYPGSTNTVMDRVVSSYSSSVKALIQGRQNTIVCLRLEIRRGCFSRGQGALLCTKGNQRAWKAMC